MSKVGAIDTTEQQEARLSALEEHNSQFRADLTVKQREVRLSTVHDISLKYEQQKNHK